MARPATACARLAVGRAWATAFSSGEQLMHLSPQARHEFRKALKSLRYAAEIAARLDPQPGTEPFLQCLRRVQSSLGRLNDVVTLQALAPPELDEDARTALADICENMNLEAEAILARAGERWRALAEAQQFWR